MKCFPVFAGRGGGWEGGGEGGDGGGGGDWRVDLIDGGGGGAVQRVLKIYRGPGFLAAL